MNLLAWYHGSSSHITDIFALCLRMLQFLQHICLHFCIMQQQSKQSKPSKPSNPAQPASSASLASPSCPSCTAIQIFRVRHWYFHGACISKQNQAKACKSKQKQSKSKQMQAKAIKKQAKASKSHQKQAQACKSKQKQAKASNCYLDFRPSGNTQKPSSSRALSENVSKQKLMKVCRLWSSLTFLVSSEAIRASQRVAVKQAKASKSKQKQVKASKSKQKQWKTKQKQANAIKSKQKANKSKQKQAKASKSCVCVVMSIKIAIQRGVSNTNRPSYCFKHVCAASCHLIFNTYVSVCLP